MLICPEEVAIAKRIGGLQDLKYKNLKITFRADLSRKYAVFSLLYCFGDATADLAQDHEKNKEAENLLALLERCEVDEQRAAVLSLVWVCLVKGQAAIHTSFSVSPISDSGLIQENSEMGFYFRPVVSQR